ncbi:MAG: translation elongation factor Ts [Arenicellales bacterium]|nr:translation elongation factor Ts [Arenicellales bacterium]
MTITAAMVKALRERTGAGMMECKKALAESGGDMDAAIEELRKKGAAKADQKSGRIAAEGAISGIVTADGTSGVLVEINCETDFVAKDENFRAFGQKVAEIVLAQNPESVDALAKLKFSDSQQTVDEARVELFSKVGENLSVRRFARLDAGPEGRISVYLHGTRIGVLVHTQGGRSDLGRDIAMHVAASRPLCISRDDVPEGVLSKEREIYTAQAADSGKPQNIVDKIVEGRLQKYLNEVTLLGQPYVKDPDQSVQKLLASEDAQVVEFVRFEVGEGLERKEDDFVAEVMAQAKGG